MQIFCFSHQKRPRVWCRGSLMQRWRRRAAYRICIFNNTSEDPCRALSIARWLVKLFRLVNSNLYEKINWSHLCQLRKWVTHCLERGKKNATNWTDGERNLISMEMTNEKVGRVQARTVADCLCRWHVFFFLSRWWFRAGRGVAAVKHISRSSSRFLFTLVLYYNWHNKSSLLSAEHYRLEIHAANFSSFISFGESFGLVHRFQVVSLLMRWKNTFRRSSFHLS